MRFLSATRSCTICFWGLIRSSWDRPPLRWPPPTHAAARDDLELNIHPAARVYILPCIAGHVGADAAAVALAEAPDKSDDLVLIVDVGTNAEILLGNREKVLACSSPTGPAFEGAQISRASAPPRARLSGLRLTPLQRRRVSR